MKKRILVLALLGAVLLCVAACGSDSSEPTPTLVPTLGTVPTATVLQTPPPPPTPAAHASPTPTIFIPLWRTVTLSHTQSFDFDQKRIGQITGGDLYYLAQDTQQGGACFWANNTDQIGGRDLGFHQADELETLPLPRDRYSNQCLLITRGHVYVYAMKGDARLAVFRVAANGPNTVTLQYLIKSD